MRAAHHGDMQETDVSDSVTFLASIAPLQSAINIASDGGARVKLDIPEAEMDAVVKLLGMREQVLRVTVETVK
jgi:hypothetical protein